MDIITKARELGKELQKDEAVVRMILAQSVYENDIDLQITIDKFNTTRDLLNQEMYKSPRDDEKIQSLNEEMRGYYQTVMESESMINYTNSKREVDDLIQKISKILSASVEGVDPYSVDVTESCTGSCSSCSGCGG
ncbi:MAG: YlbF family regulator [Oscillospiraceae bacterium]|nr:YlbF family regulator [Oscillospiraceae bacterium]